MSLGDLTFRTACLFSLVLMLFAAETSAITVSLSSTPPAHTIRPDADMARVTLAVQHDGQPLRHGQVKVKVTAPPRPGLLSTDFPVVEATTLLELVSDLRDGAFSFDYLFPIRGAYTFDVALQPAEGAPPFPPETIQKAWQLQENPVEIRNVWFLVLGLFLLGGVFGVVLARSARAKSALALTVLLGLTGWGMQAEGDGRLAAEAAKAQHEVLGEDGWALQVRPTPPQGTVGQQVQFDMVLSRNGDVFPEATEVAFELHHIEDGKPVFKTDILAPRGETSQRFQFFDGAPHRVMITARPAGRDQADAIKPLQAVFDMDVHGIQPPLAVKLRTLALLIGVLTIGMVAGWFCPVRSQEAGGASIR